MMSAAACTGAGYENVPDGDAPTRVSGMLFIERAQGGTTTGVQVGARFVRYVGVADEALPDLVGTPTVPRLGACVSRGATAGDALDPLRSEVRLLDVGPIEVHAGARSVQMHPRRFPDLWNVVSGTLYGAEADLPVGEWHFAAGGAANAGVGGFEVTGQAPESPMGVRIGANTLPVAPTQTLAIAPTGPIHVRWERATGDDRIAIRFEGDGSLVCGASDGGAFDLDVASADRAREVIRAGGTVSVHRMRSIPFSARGLDAATLVFDHAVRARVRVE
jgi:hypothetical protein